MPSGPYLKVFPEHRPFPNNQLYVSSLPIELSVMIIMSYRIDISDTYFILFSSYDMSTLPPNRAGQKDFTVLLSGESLADFLMGLN